jgi:divalent metal cation (Fe/Co/Zn/Cd) transporter
VSGEARSDPSGQPSDTSQSRDAQLLRRGLGLEYATLGWNVIGVVVTAVGAIVAGSVALAGFGFDSLIEIGASLVVVWQLTGMAADRQRRAIRLIGGSFVLLVVYLVALIAYTVVGGHHPIPSVLGIGWTALTFGVMLSLAYGKNRTGEALGNPVLRAEGRVTLADAYLAGAVLVGLALNAAFGWWWADPASGLVIIYYGVREARAAWQIAGPPEPA